MNGRKDMADTNKNMDNEQTVYYDNQNQAGGGVQHNPYVQQGGQQNPHNPYVQQGGQQNPHNPYVQQAGQQNPHNPYVQQGGQQNPHNPYVQQVGQQNPHNLYVQQAGQQNPHNPYVQQVGQQNPYNPYVQPGIPPQIPKGYGGRKKKSNAALITLIIIIILLFCAIIGVTLFIFLHSSDDDDRVAAHEFSSEYDKDEEDDDHESKLHNESVKESKKESKVESRTEKSTEELTEAVWVSVPDLTGMDINEAIKYCAENNFIIESDKQYSNMPYNTIIQQTPEPKSELKKGAVISVIVSQGPEPEQEITVPNVCGKTFEEARDELEKLELFVNSAYEENENAAAGKVIEQSAAAGAKVKKGTSVLLTVSMGSEKKDNGYQKGKVVTEETDLNVRKGPGKSFDVCGTVAKDSTVEIVSSEGDWYKIVFRNDYGYVSKDYIQVIN